MNLFCRYFMNLCQEIHGGLPGCPGGATVCRRLASGTTQSLGRGYTQKMTYTGIVLLSLYNKSYCNAKWLQLKMSFTEDQKKIFVSYGAGDDICGNGVKANTVIELSCGSTVGHPTLAKYEGFLFLILMFKQLWKDLQWRSPNRVIIVNVQTQVLCNSKICMDLVLSDIVQAFLFC